MPEKREKAPGLAVLVGVGKAKPAPKGMGGMGMGEMGEDMGPSPEFESAALEAFPDFTPQQVSALYRAIRACED